MGSLATERHRSEIELVEYVEEIGTQFQVRALAGHPRNLHVLREGEIRLEEVRTSPGIAANPGRSAGRNVEISGTASWEVAAGHEGAVGFAVVRAAEVHRGPDR